MSKSKTTKMADDIIVFHKEDLPKTAFPVFEDIRRQGKLCDVTLKVNILMSCVYLQHWQQNRDHKWPFGHKLKGYHDLPKSPYNLSKSPLYVE